MPLFDSENAFEEARESLWLWTGACLCGYLLRRALRTCVIMCVSVGVCRCPAHVALCRFLQYLAFAQYGSCLRLVPGDAYVACCRCGLWGAGYSMLLCVLQSVLLPAAAAGSTTTEAVDRSVAGAGVAPYRLLLDLPTGSPAALGQKAGSCLLLNCVADLTMLGCGCPCPRNATPVLMHVSTPAWKRKRFCCQSVWGSRDGCPSATGSAGGSAWKPCWPPAALRGLEWRGVWKGSRLVGRS